MGRQKKKTKCGDFCIILQSRDSFTGVRHVQFHRACLQKDQELGLMPSFTAILKSSIIYFLHRALHFHIELGPENYVAGLRIGAVFPEPGLLPGMKDPE